MKISFCELICEDLALKRNLYEAHQKIYDLKSQIMKIDLFLIDVSGSENKTHELNVIAKNQMKKFKNGKNRNNNQKINSIISIVNKITFLFPENQNDEKNKFEFKKRK
jgi:hypothetical protein